MSDHDNHPNATLSIATPTADGGRIFQSWEICACGVPGLRDQMGPPHQESYAEAATVQATAQAVLDTPGNIQFGR
ncbi:hypothetical protein [Nocardiopsis synnemataformans]|uniref:hypothetical protein n=1 Tax=Nocardiopsis synnemataformans TaxID=61305 RepID=UPI003EB95CAC